MEVLFDRPEKGRPREIRSVTIAEAIDLIEKERRRRNPKWRQYYLKHHDEELSRQRAYRATHREHVREYNHHYYESRRKRKATSSGRTPITQEAAPCLT